MVATVSSQTSDYVKSVGQFLAHANWPTLVASPSVESDKGTLVEAVDMSAPFSFLAENQKPAYEINRAQAPTTLGSPFEGCLSDSAGSPDSARDFLTSPSLFDDCDFEFDNDDYANFPLFPASSFENQVETDTRTDPAPHPVFSSPPSLSTEMTQRFSAKAPSQPVAQLQDSKDRSNSLSNYLVDNQIQLTGDALVGQLVQPQKLVANQLYQANQTPLKPEPFGSKQSDLSVSSTWIHRGEGSLAQAYGLDSDDPTYGRDTSPSQVPLHNDLVPYYGPEDVPKSTVSTLAMALEPNGQIAFCPPKLESTMSASPQVTSIPIFNDIEDGSMQDASAYDAKESASIGPRRTKRARNLASPLAVAHAIKVEEVDDSPFACSGSSKAKKFQCEFCAKWFDRAFNLKTHMFTHEDPENRRKSFICPDPSCEKAFARKHDMKRHHNTVHLRIVKRSSRKQTASHAVRNDDLG